MLHAYDQKHLKIPSRYAINLMWINRTLDPNQLYLSAHKSEEEMIKEFLDKAKKWQDANSEAEVNIWYDSQFVTKEAINRTQAILDTKVQNEARSKIKLRDVRELDIVKNNPDVFSDMIPVYLRVDILKLVLSLYSIEHDSFEVSIFSDLNVGDYRDGQDRMNKDELFSSEIMKRLSELGMLLGIDSWGKVENKFIQMLNKPETLLALKLTIDANMNRIITALKLSQLWKSKGIFRELSSAGFTTLLYETIPLILGLSSEHPNHKRIKVNMQPFDQTKNEEWVDYNPYTHGCLPLGNFYRAAYGGAMILSDDYKEIKRPEESIKLPTVPLELKVGRANMHTPAGSDHAVFESELIDRPPADGKEYQCHFIITPETVQQLTPKIKTY